MRTASPAVSIVVMQPSVLSPLAPVFADRRDGSRRLGQALAPLASPDVVVAALRAGVPVGEEVARVLDADFFAGAGEPARHA
jgi:hypothetical protein